MQVELLGMKLIVPVYGLMILTGVAVCNLLAFIIIRRWGLDRNEYFRLLLSGGAGALAGARLLSSLSYLMASGDRLLLGYMPGYSYYGGLAGFLLGGYVAGRLCRIEMDVYVRALIFLLPLLHVFWRLGCFFGGCCFGIPYDGIFSYTYAEGVNELSGIPVFPVQLLEALLSALIALRLFVMGRQQGAVSLSGTLLLLYGAARFVTEFFRYQGKEAWVLTDGQWYSVLSMLAGLFLIHRSIKTERTGS